MIGLYRGICYWQIKGSDIVIEEFDKNLRGLPLKRTDMKTQDSSSAEENSSSQIRIKVQYNFIVTFSNLKLGISRDNYFIVQELLL